MKSPKTTIAGVIAFLALFFSALSAQLDGDPETVADWNKVVDNICELVAGGAILYGFFSARDKTKEGPK